jgi:NitT/TauT family transport system ATP-binding protein
VPSPDDVLTPAAAEPLLALQDVDLQFAGGVQALRGLSMQVRDGEFVALLGPSGCGKSTVLRLLSGLQSASRGRVVAPAVGGEASGAETAFVFQDATLMPWASVFDNVRLPLRLKGVSRQDSEPAVREQLAAVGLSDFAETYPAQLSGGMKMRASIARALVTQPRVLLMDEPFAALDDLTRQRLHGDLMRWWARLRPATVFVTHSVAEAVMLSQRVLVMSPRPGRIAAEVIIEAPHPREASFRHDAACFEAQRQVARAMELASA